MDIIEKIKSLLTIDAKKSSVSIPDAAKISMSEREEKRYDEEILNLQKLYERWTCKEKWLLYDEGMPLLLGLEPEGKTTLDEEISNKIESLWEHAQECVQKKLLPIINIEQTQIDWEVRPIDLYSWGMISRITMPVEFSTLMTFVAQTIKPIETQSNAMLSESAEDMLYQKHREIVLGAATSLLVNAPAVCKNKKDIIVSNKIARVIIENEEQWFGNDKPLLTESVMTDLINEYLKLTKPTV